MFSNKFSQWFYTLQLLVSAKEKTSTSFSTQTSTEDQAEETAQLVLT